MHTGDFRADKSVCSNPIVKALKGQVDYLYLDTTYCGPKHAFPEQQEVSGGGGMVTAKMKTNYFSLESVLLGDIRGIRLLSL